MLRNGVLCKSITFSLPDMKLKVPISTSHLSANCFKSREEVNYNHVRQTYSIPPHSTISHTSPAQAPAYSEFHPHPELCHVGPSDLHFPLKYNMRDIIVAKVGGEEGAGGPEADYNYRC
jgi:hypothetical protein